MLISGDHACHWTQVAAATQTPQQQQMMQQMTNGKTEISRQRMKAPMAIPTICPTVK
jgi:hypothetical protein